MTRRPAIRSRSQERTLKLHTPLTQRATALAPALLFLGLSGCLSWYSDEIATGLSRLTMRNLGAIASMVGKDERCGFESQAVKESAVVEGPIGGVGKVTWRVEGCRIDAADGIESRDCNGRIKKVSGAAVVTATKVVEGRLTGDVESPV